MKKSIDFFIFLSNFLISSLLTKKFVFRFIFDIFEKKTIRYRTMKNILGLDLGSGSIGWSVIQEGENTRTILGMGSRIIPLSPDDTTQFTQGKSITKNADRTAFRTQRKGYDRYQLRRHYLTQYLHKLGMLPDERLIKLPQTELWEIRAKALNEKIEQH